MANQTTPFTPVSPSSKMRKVLVKAGSTAPEYGQLLVQNTGGDVEYAVLPSDGASNAQNWVGVVGQVLSAVTASADGEYLVFDPRYTSFVGVVTTAGNLADSVLNTKVTLDVNSDDQTIDEDDTTNGVLFIEDYNSSAGTVTFSIDADNVIGNA